MPRNANRNGNPFKSDPRGDPLAGWGQENLAAPRPQRQDQDAPMHTTYGDEELILVDQQQGDATRKQDHQAVPRAPNPPAEQHLQVPPRHGNRQQSGRENANKQSNPPAQSTLPQHQVPAQPANGSHEPKYTKEEKNACPHGDIRWPPPGEYAEPLQFFYEDKAERKRIFYNLVHDNTTPKAATWRSQVIATGKAAQKEKKDTSAQMSLNCAIVMRQGMRKISSGARGTIWLLDEGFEHVVECLTIVQKQSPHRAVRVAEGDYQKFCIFGLGVKGIKGDVLLLSEKVEVVKPGSR